MVTQGLEQAVAGVPVSGTSMVIRDQDPFFGSIGTFAARQLGLVGTGLDGQVTPLFRTNIFDRRDPSMTGRDYRMSAMYSRRMADIGAMQTASMSRSIDRAFDEGSAMGSLVYERDANGRYVQSPGMINAYNFVRNLATSPGGASAIGGIVNNALGYDRGAGMSVFAKQADSIAASMPAFLRENFSMADDGTVTYRRPDLDSEAYQRSRTTAAGMLNSSLQRTMYDGGLVKDWDTTHGVSEGLAAQIMTDAVKGGRLNRRSEMTPKDRETRKKIDDLERRMRENQERIAGYKRDLEDKLSGDDVKASINSEIQSIEADNAKMAGQRRTLQKSMTSYDWDGDFSEVVAQAMQYDKDIAAKNEILYGKDGNGGLLSERDAIKENFDREMAAGHEDKARELERQLATKVAEIEKVNSELKVLTSKQDDISKAIDGVSKEILEEVTGAVDTAKNLFGDEQSAYQELYRMTGGSISKEKGVGQSMNLAMQEYLDVGESRGLSREYMSGLLGHINGQVRSGYGVSDLFADTGLSALMSVRYATQAALGSTKGNDRENEQVGAAVSWRAGNAARSTMRPLLIQLQTAYNEGKISEHQYRDLAEDLTSGDGKTRKSAQDRLYSVMYDGDVEEGYRQRDSAAEMNFLEGQLGGSAADVERMFGKAERNETMEAEGTTRANRELAVAHRNLAATGMKSSYAQEMEDEQMYNGMTAGLEALVALGGEGSQQADVALGAIRQIMVENNENKAEGYAKARKWMETAGRNLLGNSYTSIDMMGKNAASTEINRYLDQEVNADVEGEYADMLGAMEGALHPVEGRDGGRLTVGNLAKIGDALFGENSDEFQSAIVGKEEQARYDAARKAYNKAKESGNQQEMLRIQQEFINERGSTASTITSNVAKSHIGRSVMFETQASRDEEEKRRQGGDGRTSYEQAASEAQWLRRKGVPVTAETLAWARNANVLTAESELTDEQRAELKKLRDEAEKKAHRNATPGMEAIVNAIQGKGSFSQIWKNGNLSDEEYGDRMSDLAATLGFTGSSGDGSRLLGLFTGTAVGGQGQLVKGLSKLGGENAEEFAKLYGIDPGKFKNLANSYHSALGPVGQKDAMLSMLSEMEKGAQKQYDDYAAELEKKGGGTDEEKKRLSMMKGGIAALQNEQKGLRNGVFGIADATAGVGASSEQIQELLDKLGVLIDTLKPKAMDGTYGRR